jgi:hypothetical protein
MIEFLGVLAKRLLFVLPWAFVYAIFAANQGWPTVMNFAAGIAIGAVAWLMFPTPGLEKQSDGQGPRGSKLD